MGETGDVRECEIESEREREGKGGEGVCARKLNSAKAKSWHRKEMVKREHGKVSKVRVIAKRGDGSR